MGNWWDVITSPIQQAVQNVQQTVSNIISPPPPQPTQTVQPTSYSGGGAGYTSVLINPATNQPIGTPTQIYSSGGGSYVPSPPVIPSQVTSGNVGGGAGYTPKTITNLPGGGFTTQTIQPPIQSSISSIPIPPSSSKGSNYTFEPSPYVGGFLPWTDPRTQTLWASERQAIESGYGKPVNTPNTIVMVGSQGNYTQGGNWISSLDQFKAPGADNSGYVNLARANFLMNTPSNDAGYARDWIGSFANMQSRAGVPLSQGAGGIGNYGTLNDVWGADLGKTDMSKYAYISNEPPKPRGNGNVVVIGGGYSSLTPERMDALAGGGVIPKPYLNVGGGNKQLSPPNNDQGNLSLGLPPMDTIKPYLYTSAIGAFTGSENKQPSSGNSILSLTGTLGTAALYTTLNMASGFLSDITSSVSKTPSMASSWLENQPRAISLPSFEPTTFNTIGGETSSTKPSVVSSVNQPGFFESVIGTLQGGAKYYIGLGGENQNPLLQGYAPSASTSDLTTRLERSGSASGGFVSGFADIVANGLTLGGWNYTGGTFGENQVVSSARSYPIGNATVAKMPETITTTPFGGNQTISDLKSWLTTNEGKIDLTSAEQVAQWNTNRDIYMQMQKENPSGFNTVISGGNVTTQKYETTPAVVNKYGYFDTLGTWAGGEVNRLFYGNMTPEQLAAKTQQAEGKQGFEWLAANAEVGFQKTMTGKPTELLWYVPMGAGLASLESLAVEAIAGYGASTLPGSVLVRTAITPVAEAAAGALPVAQTFRDQALGWGYRHGGQLLLTALATDVVTEHGTAPPSKTVQNIGGAIPGATIVAGSWSLSSGVGSPTPPEMPGVPASRGRGGVGGTGGSGGMGTGTADVFGTPKMSGAFDFASAFDLSGITNVITNYGSKSLMGAGEVPVYNEITRTPIYNEVSQSTITKDEIKSYTPASMYLPASPVYTEKVATDFINNTSNPVANKFVNPTTVNYDNPNAYWWENPNRFVTAEPTKNQYGNPTKNQYGNPTDYVIVLPTRDEYGFPTKTPYETPNPYKTIIGYQYPEIVVNKVVYENPNKEVTRYEYERVNRTTYDRLQQPTPGFPPISIPSFGGGGGGAGGSPKNKQSSRFTDIFRYGQGIGSFGSVNPIRFDSYRKPAIKHSRKK